MGIVMERLRSLGIELPSTRPPVVDGYLPSFAPYVRTGNMVYISGRLGKRGGSVWQGKLGRDLSSAEGAEAARAAAVELIAILHEAAGDLDSVSRMVRLLVFVNSTPDFTEPHLVANGASDLLMAVFGQRGLHARSAVAVAQLPFGSCVEIELLAEIDDKVAGKGF